MRISDAHLTTYRLPLGPPLNTARGRFTQRSGILLRLTDDCGRIGWGEAATWPGFGSGPQAIRQALDAVRLGLAGEVIEDSVHGIAARSAKVEIPEARAALEVALLDLLGRRMGVPIALLLADRPLLTVGVQALVADPEAAVAALERGFTSLKVKVGISPWALDIDRVAANRAAAGPAVSLRVDANGAWTPDVACEAIRALGALGVAWIEQPVPASDVDGLAAVRRQGGVRVAADESLTDAASLRRLIDRQAVDGVVIKPMLVGGLLAARQLAQQAGDAGLHVCISHLFESAVGRTAALHLAAALGDATAVHGLSSPLARDVADIPGPVAGRVCLPGGPGLGVEPRQPRAAVAVPSPVRSTAMARPDHPVLICHENTWTAAELDAQVGRIAGALRDAGVTATSRVALIGTPSLEWVAACHAIGWLGAAVCPIPPGQEPERDAAINLLQATHVAGRGASQSEFSVSRCLQGEISQPHRSAPSPDPPERPWPFDEVRAVLLTSGSTGHPKPVELTTSQILMSAFGSAIRLGHHLDDRWLCCLPLHHVGGLSILWRAALYGTTVELGARFDAVQVAERLDSGEVTGVSLVPTMLHRVLDARDATPFPMALRAVLLGGAAASDELVARCNDLDVPLALTWGMTETASQAATSIPGRAVAGQVGPPMPFTRVTERAGRLSVHGPIAIGGTVETADLGALTVEGSVMVHGRADDGLLCGGEVIQPREVEAVLRENPAVGDAALVGSPDAEWGERAVAFVTPTSERSSARALSAWCRERLAVFKVPALFLWIDRLPKTQTGKVDRQHLRRLVRDHAEALESGAEVGRHGDRLQGGDVDEGVHQARAGAHVARIGAGDRVVDSHRRLADAANRQVEDELVTESDRTLKVGLGMNDRRTPSATAEHLAEASRRQAADELFVGRVAVLEESRKEDEAGAVDLSKAHGDRMLESHDPTSRRLAAPTAHSREETSCNR
ncbi:MAG: o-succinylbenzoate synthase [Myxococcota bacterium]